MSGLSSKKEFASADKIHSPNKSDSVMQNTIKNFSKMIEFENFIISNSTYSWWAARLDKIKTVKSFTLGHTGKVKIYRLFYKKMDKN